MREFNAKLGSLELSFEWRTTLLVCVLLPLLVALGFWQLERAEKKRAIAAQFEQRNALAPLSLAELKESIAAGAEDLADRAVSFLGAITPDSYFLLDNRQRDGRFGYELIALVAADGVAAPVNLGWVPGDPARQVLPAVELPSLEYRFEARVYAGAGQEFLLSEQAVPTSIPAVIQSYQPKRFSTGLVLASGLKVLPALLRIDSNHPLARRADWPIVNQSPEKHTGYAVQWFTMAAVLLVVFVFRTSNLASLLRNRYQNTNPQ